MRLSNAFLRLAVVFIVIGVSLGYYMGSTQTFTAAPVHAHINLLGWVSMFLYGLFYRANPQAAEGWLPRVHFWFALIGFLIFMPALLIEVLQYQPAIAFAHIGLIAGPTLVVIGMILFAVIVFRATGTPKAAVA
jgi:hypothetical protein